MSRPRESTPALDNHDTGGMWARGGLQPATTPPSTPTSHLQHGGRAVCTSGKPGRRQLGSDASVFVWDSKCSKQRSWFAQRRTSPHCHLTCWAVLRLALCVLLRAVLDSRDASKQVGSSDLTRVSAFTRRHLSPRSPADTCLRVHLQMQFTRCMPGCSLDVGAAWCYLGMLGEAGVRGVTSPTALCVSVPASPLNSIRLGTQAGGY
ncbi:hypothetical protein B0H10DRAFT_2213605 [Mycena sp. CBHHK59/15]|nr:hypothetical protein B0H10DRAFT_2213605 [Mycena sp. CBHHK59/15]